MLLTNRTVVTYTLLSITVIGLSLAMATLSTYTRLIIRVIGLSLTILTTVAVAVFSAFTILLEVASEICNT